MASENMSDVPEQIFIQHNMQAVDMQSELIRLREENERLRIRGDGHAETLRGIAKMDPATEGERMRLWARDGLSGYTQSTEATVKEQQDENNRLQQQLSAAEKRVRELEGLLERMLAWIKYAVPEIYGYALSDDEIRSETPIMIEIENVLAALTQGESK